MRATVLDSEGVTLITLIEVDDSCRAHGIRIPVQPRLRDLLAPTDPLDPIPVRETRAVYERTRGDGVAIFRRSEA